jgi:hypothetical protein
MDFAAAVVATALAVLLVVSAARKLSHGDEVVAGYERAGVAERHLNLLAVLLIAAAVGLLAGQLWAPIGIAAAACLVVYFFVAAGAHVRAGDAANLVTPLLMLGLSIVTLVLFVTTL